MPGTRVEELFSIATSSWWVYWFVFFSTLPKPFLGRVSFGWWWCNKPITKNFLLFNFRQLFNPPQIYQPTNFLQVVQINNYHLGRHPGSCRWYSNSFNHLYLLLWGFHPILTNEELNLVKCKFLFLSSLHWVGMAMGMLHLVKPIGKKTQNRTVFTL